MCLKRLNLLSLFFVAWTLSGLAVEGGAIAESITKECESGDYTIVEYLHKPIETMELQKSKKAVFVKLGDDLAIMHPTLNVPIVMLRDTNGDGEHDRIEYDVWNEKGKLIASSADHNYDGQLDWRMTINYQAETELIDVYVWVDSAWRTVRAILDDSKRVLVREVDLDGEWKVIKLNVFPFQVGE